MLSQTNIVIGLLGLATAVALLGALLLWRRQRGLRRQLAALHEEVRDVALDASVGRRLVRGGGIPVG